MANSNDYGKVLYLPIKQKYFDQIIAGTKKFEYREVKPTTYKRLIEIDENGFEVQDENGNSVPIQYDALHLRCGMNVVADECVVKVLSVHTEIFTNEDGSLIEYVTDKSGNILLRDSNGKIFVEKDAQRLAANGVSLFYLEPQFNEDGECTNGLYWVAQQVVYELGEILEKNIHTAAEKKNTKHKNMPQFDVKKAAKSMSNK